MESIISSAVIFALGSLREIVIHYYDLICHTKDDVNDLCEHLDTLKWFVEDYIVRSSRSIKNTSVEKLAKDVREVVFKAEDAIETYVVATSLQRDRKLGKQILHVGGYVSDLADVANQIKNVSVKVQELYPKMEKLWESDLYKSNSDDDDDNPEDLPDREEKTNMVGLRDQLDTVIGLLKKKSDNLEVITITGMPGSGKTTFALQVKDHPIIKLEFPNRAFIRVSQKYKPKEIFFKILRQLTPTQEDMSGKSDKDILDAIHKALEDKSYLIVMDDVWTTEAWDQLRRAFPDHKNSKVLMTSRHGPVALHANRRDDPIALRGLYEDESKELLRLKVFGKNFCPPNLEKYENLIVSKCDGLPLSILVIAGILLFNRESTGKWKSVADRVNIHVGQDEKTREVIRLSYDNLPQHLKQCFLYLGVFREEIPVWKLLRLWTAEGFVEQEEDLRFEDTAEGYLEDLVARNLVIVVERRANGQIKTCRLHDAVRRFCTEEAKTQKLFEEIRMHSEAASSTALNPYCRRLCVNSYVDEHSLTNPSYDSVRSLLISFAKEVPASAFPKGFKLLRVLDARSIIFHDFPDELLFLVLLRYMGISCDSCTLPDKVSNLRILQTIIITNSRGPLEIRAEIWKMPRLRHLHTNVSTSLYCPPAKSKSDEHLINQNIQTLSRISPESCTVDVFKRSPSIRKLGICGKLKPSIFDSLSELEFLENLKLFNEFRTRFTLPESKRFPEMLTKLTLENTLLDWECMSILAKLKNLEKLKLKEYAFLGKKWKTMKERFVRLEALHIGRTDLVEWEATADNFPMLRCLILMDCRKLKEIPSGIGFISSLECINLSQTNRKVVQSAVNIREMKRKQQLHSKTSKPLTFQLSTVLPSERDLDSHKQQNHLRISPESCTVDVFKRTPSITKLEISGKLEPGIFDSLAGLEFLENLKLTNEPQTRFALPESNKFPEMLTKLTLQNTLLNWECMSVLAKLKKLERLKLKDNAFVGKKWTTMKERFDCLEVLHIGGTDLVEWGATADNFPMLKGLILMDCRKLKQIPYGIGLISSLECINLSRTNRGVVLSALKIRALKRNLQRLPKTSVSKMFQFSAVLPSEHDLDSEPTSDDEQSNDQIIEQNDSRAEAPQATEAPGNRHAPIVEVSQRNEVPGNPKASRRWHKKILPNRWWQRKKSENAKIQD